MLIHLSNEMSIYSHNQLYGLWYVVKRGVLPQTNRQLRLGLHTNQHSALLYSASDISVWPTERIAEQPLLSKLGPDVLSPDLNSEQVALLLQSPLFRRKQLGSLYLMQAFLAGVGNYLRSEILFFAGLRQSKRPVDLTMKEVQRLAEVTLKICQRSYLTGGYTTPESLRLAAIKKGEGFEQSRFMVFDREGRPCRLCSTLIQRLERNGRRWYFCPACQPPD